MPTELNTSQPSGGALVNNDTSNPDNYRTETRIDGNNQPYQVRIFNGSSPTTISNGNKIDQAPAIQQKFQDNTQKGITTNPDGSTSYANGTAYNPPPTDQGGQALFQGNTYTDYSGLVKPITKTSPPAGSVPDGKGNYVDSSGNLYSPETGDTSYQDKQINDNLAQIKSTTDALTASAIDSIQKNYTNLINQQRQTNQGQTARTTNALLMGGVTGQGSSAQFAPVSSEGILSSQINYGLQQISELEAKEDAAIQTAKATDWSNASSVRALANANAEIEKIRSEKIDAAKKLNETILEQTKKASDEKMQSDKDSAVAEQIAKGVTDPAAILKNIKGSGMVITAKEIQDSLAAVAKANGTDLSKLSADTQTFFYLKNQKGGLPTSILALPDTASQLAAYLKMINKASTSYQVQELKANNAGTGALNVARTAGISDTTVPLSDVINSVGMDTLVQGIINNEGGSLSGVVNNPGNIKYIGLPGQTDSGVKAGDGGTFANYATPEAGKQAIANQIQVYANKGMTFEDAINKYTNTTPSIITQQDKDFAQEILNGNATTAQVPAANKANVARILNSSGIAQYSPLAASRFTTASNRITTPYRDMAAYKLTADGLTYLTRIDAAMKTPGSISDQDLLDSLTKLNTGGNAVSDAQVKLITDGKSFSDAISVWGNKAKNGGVLSDSQRKQVQEIAKNIFDNYKKAYQPVYDDASKQLEDAGIPKAFWTIPDLNSLSARTQTSLGGSNATDFLNNPVPGTESQNSTDFWNNAK